MAVPISTPFRALSAVSGTLLFKPRGFSQRLARQPAPQCPQWHIAAQASGIFPKACTPTCPSVLSVAHCCSSHGDFHGGLHASQILSVISGTLLFKPRGFSRKLARQPALQCHQWHIAVQATGIFTEACTPARSSVSSVAHCCSSLKDFHGGLNTNLPLGCLW